MEYRREIDGLRAVAVVPVILFHASFAPFAGGFVGVDVFFVISGYLITSIILAEHAEGRFSLLRFYERRARRILPALFLVMFASVPFAYSWMLADDLENFGQSVVATVLFSNNVLLWKTAGYWDLASEFKPLLHTWSLGVEEQYYIIFPVLLIAVWPAGRRWPLYAFAAIAAASLALAVGLAPRAPEFDFYMLPTRAWELMIGAMIAGAIPSWRAWSDRLAARRWRSEALGLAGLAMVVWAVFAFDDTVPHPGLATLLPAGGTALVILFASPATLLGRLLGTPPLLGTGLASYSLYLWHQPVFAFTRILSFDEPSVWHYVAGIALTAVLAALSWRFVERPFRDRTRVGQLPFAIAATIAAALLVAIGLTFHMTSGLASRWAELDGGITQDVRERHAAYNMRPLRLENVPFPDNGRTNVLVVGTSFARDFINAAEENGYFAGDNLSYNTDWQALNCIDLAMLRTKPIYRLLADTDVLIFGAPSVDPVCWTDDETTLRTLGIGKFVVIGDKNFGWNLNAVLHLDPPGRYAFRTRVLRDVADNNARMAALVGPGQYVDLLALLADADGRVPVFTPDRKLITQDRQHLTQAGARYIGKVLFDHPLLREYRQ
jgi:peptidoglycan/LPS O-acetylase OafA/YrhL